MFMVEYNLELWKQWSQIYNLLTPLEITAAMRCSEEVTFMKKFPEFLGKQIWLNTSHSQAASYWSKKFSNSQES